MPQTKKRQKRGYTVFLSHSSRDTWIAGVIADRIKSSKINVWLDEMSLSGGDSIIAAIVQAMRDADEAVVLVSPESVNLNGSPQRSASPRAYRKESHPC